MTGCLDTPNSALSDSTDSRSPDWYSPSSRRSLSRSYTTGASRRPDETADGPHSR